MNDLNLVVEFAFDTMSRVAGMITSNWILLLFFAIGIFRIIMEVFYKIKRKGGF